VVEDEMMVIRPALEGTKRVLTAALNAKVKRVVLTSSVAAIAVGHDNKQNFDESDWTQTNKPIAAYPKSKALAERAAWDFVQANPSLELVSINPSLVVGPILDKQVNSSLEPIFRIMKGMYPAMPRIGWNFVDVRDVAAAHIAALTVPEAAGQRFCCTNDWRWLSDVAKVLDHHYSSKGYRIATGTLPNFVVRLIALFDKSVRMVVGNLGRRVEYDNSQIKKVLKWQARPVEQSIVDTAQSMIDFNLV
jgi:nucleoside-diphosphate-sugar epimerase